MAGISITRGDLTAAGLRAVAGRTKDARAARRMLAVASVLEGADRTTAAATCGMDRQTLRDRVHRDNAGGLAGLVNRMVPPRPRRLGPEQLAELAAWGEAGPGLVRSRPWPGSGRCGALETQGDLQRRIATASGVALHERSVGKQLAAPGFRRLSVRPQQPKPDPQARGGRSRELPRSGSRRDPRAGTGQAAGDLVPE